jgi:hypothetical protein
MDKKKSPQWEESAITVLSKEAVVVIEEIFEKIGDDAELRELRNLIDISLHRNLADQLDMEIEAIRKRAWEIADNIIFTWLAFQSPETKAKFLHLFKRVNAIYGEGWDYFDLLAGRSERIAFAGATRKNAGQMFFEYNADDEQGDTDVSRALANFADLDRLNNLTPTIEIRQNHWLNHSLEYRKDYVSKKFAGQIKDALNTLGEITKGKGISLSAAYQLGDEMVVALANLDYKELCQANVIADLITEMIRKKIGVNIGFCINKNNSDGFIN